MKRFVKRLFSVGVALVALSCGTNHSMPRQVAPPVEEPLRISILGDSYSTFEGYVQPDTNACWYGPSYSHENDVKRVEACWWHLLVSECGFHLERNNSFSGATICYTGYDGADYTDRSFLTRAEALGEPDVILIFGGTNDSWANAPIGELRYDSWSREELYAFAPAFCALLDRLKSTYPRAEIYNLLNTELKPEIGQLMAQACEHYGVHHVVLRDIDKQWGHPSVAGMRAICDQVKPHLVR